MKRIYNKPPLSSDDQLDVLISRVLIVNDREKAKEYLESISYYRLSAYFLPFQKAKDEFADDVDFRQIVKTYSFDRELRLLVLDCIERIEVAIRTQMVYQLSLRYNNSHWQDDESNFTVYIDKTGRKIDSYADFQKIINKALIARRPEVFINHYKNKYSSPRNPPSWMCAELLTIGQLSRVYNGLANRKDKNDVANYFGLHRTVFQSWLHSLTYVRNLAAHHARLWNRDLSIEPERLRKPQGRWVTKSFENNKRMFYFLCVLKYMLNCANPGNSLKEKMIALFNKYPTVPIQYMGIPSDNEGNLMDWKRESIWK